MSTCQIWPPTEEAQNYAASSPRGSIRLTPPYLSDITEQRTAEGQQSLALVEAGRRSKVGHRSRPPVPVHLERSRLMPLPPAASELRPPSNRR